MPAVRRVAPTEARRAPRPRGAHAGAQRTVDRQVLRRMDCRGRRCRTDESAETRARQQRRFSDAEIDEAVARFAREATGSVSSCACERWQHRAARGPGVRPPGREILAMRNGGWVNVAARISADRLAAAASVCADERADVDAPAEAIAA